MEYMNALRVKKKIDWSAPGVKIYARIVVDPIAGIKPRIEGVSLVLTHADVVYGSLSMTSTRCVPWVPKKNSPPDRARAPGSGVGEPLNRHHRTGGGLFFFFTRNHPDDHHQ